MRTRPHPTVDRRRRPRLGRRPVFVGGCPRSGTTLLGAMLGVGPDRVTVPESLFKFALLAEAEAGTVATARAHDLLAADRRFALWRVPPPARAPGRRRVAAVLDELVGAFSHRSGKPDATVWIDHTPGNIRFVGTLLDLYPEARFVNLVRDGRGVAASVLPLDWGPNRMADAAGWWATHVAMGLAAAATYGPDRVLTVRFEDLLAAPEETLTALCHSLDLPYDPAMLSRREYDVDAYTVTEHSRVAEVPDASRSRAWQQDLTVRQLEEFEYRTGELARYLGYPLLVGPGARPPPRADRLADFVVDVARRGVVDRVRRQRSERRPW